MDAATAAFLDGLSVGCLVGAGVTAFGALVAAVLLPARPAAPDEPDLIDSTGSGGSRRR